MRRILRYFGAPVVALAIAMTWGVTAASADSGKSEKSHESDRKRSDNDKKSRAHKRSDYEDKSDRIIVSNGQSIQAAIDKAAPGSTIWVREGTYAENVLINKDNIRLLGHDATIVPP